jgi:hypothetical protein
MGKSEAVKQDKARLREAQSLLFNLGQIDSEYSLSRRLFESPEFVTWINSDQDLILYLDSLDECVAKIEVVISALIYELSRLRNSLSRLKLRLVCRTAIWNPDWEAGFKGLWPDASVEAFQLAPLTESDVRLAAHYEELDDTRFIESIDSRDVSPLAAKPLTLNFLLRQFIEFGELPQAQTQIYEQGCLLLCEEKKKSRDARVTLDLHEREKRLEIASRVAALTIFADRQGVWMSPDDSDYPSRLVTIQDLYGGYEVINETEFEVREAGVRETLNTGLLTSIDINTLGWAHKSYAEFLAARYLTKHSTPIGQVMPLLINPNDPDGKIIPQLQETAAWLAALNDSLLNEILKVDPEIILLSDISLVDDRVKALLLGSLFALLNSGKKPRLDYRTYRFLNRLKFDGIDKILESYIKDREGNIESRLFAIEIARDCKLELLYPCLMERILDTAEEFYVRYYSSLAILESENLNLKAGLKPLASTDDVNDIDERLKGVALKATWPQLWTLGEVLIVLTPPKDNSFIGGDYWEFITKFLPMQLGLDEATIVLNWIQTNSFRGREFLALDALYDDLVSSLLGARSEPRHFKAFSELLADRLKSYKEIFKSHDHNTEFSKLLSNDQVLRREFVKQLIPLLADKQGAWVGLISRTPTFIRPEDFNWLLELYAKEERIASKRELAEILRYIFKRGDISQTERLFRIYENDAIGREVFQIFFEPIELSSPEAAKLKADHEELQKWENERPSKSQRLYRSANTPRLLRKFREGRIPYWADVIQSLANSDRQSFQHDITALPGWSEITTDVQSALVEGAIAFIEAYRPKVNEGLESKTYYILDFVGYQALFLLSKIRPQALDEFDDEVWCRWAPTVLVYPMRGQDGGLEVLALVRYALSRAREVFTNTLIKRLSVSTSDTDELLVLRKIEGCQDNDLNNRIFELLTQKRFTGKVFQRLLEFLLKTGHPAAVEYAFKVLPKRRTGLRVSEMSSAAAVALLENIPSEAWGRIFPLMQLDVEFGKEALRSISYYGRKESFLSELKDEQLAELYRWVLSNHPATVGRRRRRAGDDVSMFLDDIIKTLSSRGTFEACGTLQGLLDEKPDDVRIVYAIQEAKELARRSTWQPFGVQEIKTLLSNKTLRLVRNSAQLLNLVDEKLTELQAEVRGPNNFVNIFWNEWTEGQTRYYRPKSENDISDFVAVYLDRELRRSGVIINREVSIRRGERTDIHINAVSKLPGERAFDVITLIIEAKGCWNDDLESALERQLVERYMRDNLDCNVGIYLVGWFGKSRWDDRDSRKKKCRKCSIDEARNHFRAQAIDIPIIKGNVRSVVLDLSFRY